MSEGVGRRDFMRTAALATGGLILGGAEAARAFTGNAAVDEKLFQDINRAKDPAHKVGLEKLHAPVIELPARIKAGEPFAVNVAIGETLHPMGPLITSTGWKSSPATSRPAASTFAKRSASRRRPSSLPSTSR